MTPEARGWYAKAVSLAHTDRPVRAPTPRECTFRGILESWKSLRPRDQLGRLIDRAHSEPVYLTRHDRRVGAIVDADTLDRLMAAAEELDDIAAYDAAKAEGGQSVTLDELRRELGL